jgi:hypothetical protein
MLNRKPGSRIFTKNISTWNNWQWQCRTITVNCPLRFEAGTLFPHLMMGGGIFTIVEVGTIDFVTGLNKQSGIIFLYGQLFPRHKSPHVVQKYLWRGK